ncbi:MAG: tetratricopeptide repeat protein [Thermodesulfobacteriota bacterium]|nr:tetratricopeptide repeat protein [Thermodesulfobacteriota bacterium]
MGWQKLFSGKTPEQVEKRGDGLFAAGEYGRAGMEYEKSLDKWRKKAPCTEISEERLEQKIRKTREILARQHKEEGLEIMDSEYYEGAEESFRMALELTEDPELRGELEGFLERITAISGRREEIPASGSWPETEQVSGPVEVEAGAEEYFAALCNSLPEPLQQVFYGYGNAFREGYIALNQGDFEQAAQKLSQAMEEDSKADFIALELATAYLNLGSYPAARALAENFLRMHSDDSRGYAILCETLWAQEEFDAAIELLDACSVTLAESPTVVLLRGETLFRARRLEEAGHLYQRELALRGWQPEIARSLGIVYEAQGKKGEARDLFRKLLATCQTCGSTEDVFAKQRFADLSFQLGEMSTSLLELYLSLVQEDPAGRTGYYQKISHIYSARGNSEEARRFEGFAQAV